MDTNELVARAKNGDEEAFGQIYELFAQRIFRYITIKIQNRQEAEDALQDVFVKCYKSLGGLELKDLNFSAWLYKIASNVVNDYYRKVYRRPQTVEIDEGINLGSSESLQEDIQTKSDFEGAHGAFKLLNPVYRQVLELRFIQDLTLEETAKILNKSNLAIRLLQFRALKKIRIILKKD